MGEGGVLPEAGCDLSVVFDRKQPQVAVALLEHEVVCLPVLFWGGTKGKSGICEARFGEGGIGAFFVAVGLCLSGLEEGSNGGAPGCVGGVHFGGGERSILV